MPDAVHLMQMRSLKWMHFWVVGSSGSHLEESPASMPPQHLKPSSLRALPRESFPEPGCSLVAASGMRNGEASEVRLPQDAEICEAVEAWEHALRAFSPPRPPTVRESIEWAGGSAAPSLSATRCSEVLGYIAPDDRFVLIEPDRAPVLEPGESLQA
jgi:hypothetical protein